MDPRFDLPVIHEWDFFAGEAPDPLDLGPPVELLLQALRGEVDLPDYYMEEDEVGNPVFFRRVLSPAPSDEEDEEEQDEDWGEEEEDSGYGSLSEEEQEEEDEDELRRIYEEVFGSSSSDLSELAPPPTPPPAPSPAPASPALGGSKRPRDEDGDEEEDPSSKRPRWSDPEDSPEEPAPSTSAGTSGGFLRFFRPFQDPDDSDDE